MGFPAETVDGKTVIITEKGNEGDREVFRTADGSIYVASATDNLKLELKQAGEAILEGAAAVAAEAQAELAELADTVQADIEELKGLPLQDVPEEVATQVGELIDKVEESVGEVVDAAEAALDKVRDEAGDVVETAEDTISDVVSTFEDLLNRSDAGEPDSEPVDPTEPPADDTEPPADGEEPVEDDIPANDGSPAAETWEGHGGMTSEPDTGPDATPAVGENEEVAADEWNVNGPPTVESGNDPS